MRPPVGRAICWILLFAAPLTFGCRGANPLGRHVQVTETADAELPEIDVPPRRLVTPKPRVSDPVAGSPHIADSVSETRVVSSKTDVDSQTMAHLADIRTTNKTTPSPTSGSASASVPASSVAARQANKPSGAAPAVSADNTEASDNTDAAPSATPPDSGDQNQPAAMMTAQSAANIEQAPGGQIDAAELLAMIQEFPPELRQQALRQFIAAAARSAGQTDQPNSLVTELAKTMSNLPTLPEPSETPPAIPPMRIAAAGQPDDDAPAVASISDAMTNDTSSVSTATTASLSDVATGEMESAEVQSITNSAETRPSEVTTASAARAANEASMVSHAVAGANPNPAASRSDDPESYSSASKSLSVEQLLDELVNRLAASSPEESEADRTARLIKLRHLMVLAGDPDSAVEKIDGMAEAEQEYLRHHLLGLWTMIDPQGHPVPSRRFTSAIPQIREAAKFAAAATDSLEVRSLAFCTEIESYGQITQFPGNRFKPGQQVILYCEIENFTVRQVEDGYETHLQGSYDVFNAKNEKVFSQVLPADQQVSANFLRDYFIAYQMFLPSELVAGTYRLQLTMEDANGKKYGQSNIPFEIAR